MTIYKPVPQFSEDEKILLKLMSKLLLDQLDSTQSVTNVCTDTVPLSDAEALKLIELLSTLLSSREFLETSIFVEGMLNSTTADAKKLKEIFLSVRHRRGRTRALSYYHWIAFQARLGIGIDPVQAASVVPMDFQYFERMEQSLLGTSGLNYRVIDYIMKFVHSRRNDVEEVRQGTSSLPEGSMRELFSSMVSGLKDGNRREISNVKIAAGITILADMSVLFTTRDWSVAGFLSTIAGAVSTVAGPLK